MAGSTRARWGSFGSASAAFDLDGKGGFPAEPGLPGSPEGRPVPGSSRASWPPVKGTVKAADSCRSVGWTGVVDGRGIGTVAGAAAVFGRGDVVNGTEGARVADEPGKGWSGDPFAPALRWSPSRSRGIAGPLEGAVIPICDAGAPAGDGGIPARPLPRRPWSAIVMAFGPSIGILFLDTLFPSTPLSLA